MPEITVFDHYEVLRREDGSLFELGRGAMGITYKAFDTNLRCPVALKVINAASIHSDLARQRFVREARSAAQLRHRNVASVFHLGVVADTYFYAMEFIEGETVESLVRRRGPIQPILAFRIAVQVARALNAAQKHQLVHRDIKPSNLMLVREDEEVVVKVIDFGLAKSSRGEDSTGELTLAAAGFVGTPHFASPEQLQERDLDVRSDIYSLGVTLWYMLTGEAPFTGPLAQVMGHHLHTPPPLDRIAFLPEPVSRVIIEMLAKDPGQRPQNPVELRAKLEASIGFLVAAQPGGADPAVEVVLAPETGRSGGALLKSKGFYVGAIVAGRYELLRDLGESNAGWTFQAEDLRDGRKLRLLVLQADWASDPSALDQIQREVDKLRDLEHPNILRVLGLERTTDVNFILLEWTEGFSLVDLLRSRQEIDADEAILLLREIAAGVDDAIALGFNHLDFSLSHIFVHFQAAEKEPERRVATPVDRWPPFVVKINPLGITREFATSDTWAGGQTVVGDLAGPEEDTSGGPGPHYVQSLAAVVYELLGGALSPAVAGGLGTHPMMRYVPVAALPESGNNVLKRALDPRLSYGSAMEFCRSLEASLAGDYRPPTHSAFVPAAPVRPEMPGTVSPFDTKVAPAALPALQPAAAKSFPGAGLLARFPRLGLAGILACILLAFSLWLLHRPSPPPQPAVSAGPSSPEELPAATPPPSLNIPPSSASPPSNVPTNAALRQAEQYEAAQDWPRAIEAYCDFTRSFPAVDAGRIRLETLLSSLTPNIDKMSPREFAPLRPAIADAAAQNIVSAMVLLADQLRSEAPAEAYAWYCAAAVRGNASAMTQAGLMVSNAAGVPRDYPQAAAWFQMAANAGDAAGRTCLAECYLYGTGVRKDERRAIPLLQDSVDAGDVRAMNLLGNCYHQGIGVAKNYVEAFELFSRAHDLGFAAAAGNLGVLYMNGDGVTRDLHRGVNLFIEGSQNGSPYCMYLLAKCLQYGTGVTASPSLAEAWYRKAAAGGNPMAIAWCNANHVSIPNSSPDP